MYDAAPDLNSLVIEGLEEKPGSGFVALDKLVGSVPRVRLVNVVAPHPPAVASDGRQNAGRRLSIMSAGPLRNRELWHAAPVRAPRAAARALRVVQRRIGA